GVFPSLLETMRISGEAIAGVEPSAKVLDRHAVSMVATPVSHIGASAVDLGVAVGAPLGLGSGGDRSLRQHSPQGRGQDCGAGAEPVQELPPRHACRRLFGGPTEPLKHETPPLKKWNCYLPPSPLRPVPIPCGSVRPGQGRR